MQKKYSVRGPAWNYNGSHWKLSRSKIDLFTECRRCFFLDNRLGIKRPSMPPFSLNVAVDTLLKQEFDVHRSAQTSHPLMKAYGLRAVPASHPMISIWRENFKGITYTHPETQLRMSGAIDDLWLLESGEYAVVDYKATAKDEDVTELNDTWHDGYRRQVEVYQWLLRRQGLTVSDTGYFVYCNGRSDKKAFDGKLEFNVHLIEYKGNDSWIEQTLREIHAVLESNIVPASDDTCEYCGYRDTAGKELQKIFKHNPALFAKEVPRKISPKKQTGKSLFSTTD